MKSRYKVLENKYYDNTLTEDENVVYQIMACKIQELDGKLARVEKKAEKLKGFLEEYHKLEDTLHKAPFKSWAEQRKVAAICKKQIIEYKLLQGKLEHSKELNKSIESKLLEAVAAMQTDSCDKFQERYPMYFNKNKGQSV